MLADCVKSDDSSSTRVQLMHQEPPIKLDSDSIKTCAICGRKFKFLMLRKHYCRNCGQIFCLECSLNKKPLPHLGINKPVRVCNNCFDPKPSILVQGDIFTRYRSNHRGPELVWVCFTKNLDSICWSRWKPGRRFEPGAVEGMNCISTENIIQVSVGIQSKVLLRNQTESGGCINDKKAFTILMKIGKALDLEAGSPDKRNAWLEALSDNFTSINFLDSKTPVMKTEQQDLVVLTSENPSSGTSNTKKIKLKDDDDML